jgi:hypothetical protein
MTMRTFSHATLTDDFGDRIGTCQIATADALERVADRTESLIADIRALAADVDTAVGTEEVNAAGFTALDLIDQVQSYLARDGRKLAEAVATFSYEQGRVFEQKLAADQPSCR